MTLSSCKSEPTLLLFRRRSEQEATEDGRLLQLGPRQQLRDAERDARTHGHALVSDVTTTFYFPFNNALQWRHSLSVLSGRRCASWSACSSRRWLCRTSCRRTLIRTDAAIAWRSRAVSRRKAASTRAGERLECLHAPHRVLSVTIDEPVLCRYNTSSSNVQFGYGTVPASRNVK